MKYKFKTIEEYSTQDICKRLELESIDDWELVSVTAVGINTSKQQTYVAFLKHPDFKQSIAEEEALKLWNAPEHES